MAHTGWTKNRIENLYDLMTHKTNSLSFLSMMGITYVSKFSYFVYHNLVTSFFTYETNNLINISVNKCTDVDYAPFHRCILMNNSVKNKTKQFIIIKQKKRNQWSCFSYILHVVASGQYKIAIVIPFHVCSPYAFDATINMSNNLQVYCYLMSESCSRYNYTQVILVVESQLCLLSMRCFSSSAFIFIGAKYQIVTNEVEDLLKSTSWNYLITIGEYMISDSVNVFL